MSTDPRRMGIEPLTGFRFIAAMMVFLSHWHIPGTDGTVIRTITRNGYSGVTFFYALSGFILAYTYLHQFEKGIGYGAAWRFYLNRFARVYPLYALSILAAIYAPGAPADNPTLAFLALQAWSPDISVAFGTNAVGWSISVEAFLYLVAPFVMFALGRVGAMKSNRSMLAWGIGFLATLAVITFWFYATGKGALGSADPRSAHRWLYRTPLLRMVDFGTGVLAAAYYMRGTGMGSRQVAFWGWAGYAAVVWTLFQMSFASFYVATFSLDFAYLVPGLLIILSISICRDSLLSRFLGSKIMVILGAASYAFYLFQFYAPFWVTIGLRYMGVDFQGPRVAYLVQVIGAILFAILLQRLVEDPCRHLIRRLGGRGASQLANRAAVLPRGPRQIRVR